MSVITSISGVSGITPVTGVSKSSGSEFGSALRSAVSHVDAEQKNASQAVEQFLQGNGEMHNVALATQRAEMEFDLAVQVRNKVISAYQEIMKMQL